MGVILKNIRSVFFPINFYEKYRYLGNIPHKEGTELFKVIYPLILAMDYDAKPKWCPRWFLRFLHLFGSYNSVVRFRNRRLYDLLRKLTKNTVFWDYKTKWRDYDLRISISGAKHLSELSDGIEDRLYKTGRSEELVKRIKEINPDANITWGSVSRLNNQLKKLKKKPNIDL